MEFITTIRHLIFLKKQSFRLWIAIKVADAKQAAYNKRFYVIDDWNHRLVIISKDDLNKLKRMKVYDKKITHLDLMRESFYYTPLSRNNNGKISEKEKAKKLDMWLKYSQKYLLKKSGS